MKCEELFSCHGFWVVVFIELCFFADSISGSVAHAAEFCLEKRGEFSAFGLFCHFNECTKFDAVGVWFDFDAFLGLCVCGFFEEVFGVVWFFEDDLCVWVDDGGALEVFVDESFAAFVVCDNVDFDSGSMWFFPVGDVSFKYFSAVFVGVYGEFNGYGGSVFHGFRGDECMFSGGELSIEDDS